MRVIRAEESGSSVRQAAQVWRRDWFRLVDTALHGSAQPSSRPAALAAAEAAAAGTATTASVEQVTIDAAYLRSIEFANSATDALNKVRTSGHGWPTDHEGQPWLSLARVSLRLRDRPGRRYRGDGGRWVPSGNADADEPHSRRQHATGPPSAGADPAEHNGASPRYTLRHSVENPCLDCSARRSFATHVASRQQDGRGRRRLS